MMFDTVLIPVGADPELVLVARELAAVCTRLDDVLAQARTLARATDWHARAAQVFHERADRWTALVASLAGHAETARHDAERAAEASRWRDVP